MIGKNTIITLEDNLEYAILDTTIINSIQYSLAINIKDKQDLAIFEILNNFDEIELNRVHGDEYEEAYKVFALSIEEIMKELLDFS